MPPLLNPFKSDIFKSDVLPDWRHDPEVVSAMHELIEAQNNLTRNLVNGHYSDLKQTKNPRRQIKSKKSRTIKKKEPSDVFCGMAFKPYAIFARKMLIEKFPENAKYRSLSLARHYLKNNSDKDLKLRRMYITSKEFLDISKEDRTKFIDETTKRDDFKTIKPKYQRAIRDAAAL